jgi:transposase
MRFRIEPMKKVVRMLRRHHEQILNYFRAQKAVPQRSRGGVKNKVKVTRRKAYDFRTFRATEIALYHVLGKLPAPEVAHRFY